MISTLEAIAQYLQHSLLGGASLLVPASERAEWLREWRTELWYVTREHAPQTENCQNHGWVVATFCLGAYPDAFWLRARFWQRHRPLARIRGSALACLCLLVGVLLMSWAFSAFSPRVAAVKEMSRIRVYPLRMGNSEAALSDAQSQVVASLGFMRQYFDGFSRYSLFREAVSVRSTYGSEWTVAHANPDLFAVLHLPVHFMMHSGTAQAQLPEIVLSHEAWMRYFGGRPNIVGTVLRVGSVHAVIAGVAGEASDDLPGNADAWLLEKEILSKRDSGVYVAGYLSAFGYFEMGPRWALSLFGVVLALLAVPGITCTSVGRLGAGSCKPSLAKRARFWAYLMGKLLLSLPIVYFISVDLDCVLARPFTDFSGYIQFLSSFVLCLLAVHWAFLDQRRRCPSCLRFMTHPAAVGQLSRTFLAWKGTELICEAGHSLLHIPDTPTSWFNVQRWLWLDGSWQVLFARPKMRPSAPRLC